MTDMAAMNHLPLRWEWDDDKNDENRRKHGISFEVAKLVFDDPLAASREDPFPREQRWRTIGKVRNVVIIVIHTSPEADYDRGEAIGRIISARKGERRERNSYAEGEF
jgi:uncharacterized DUF497 family protein